MAKKATKVKAGKRGVQRPSDGDPFVAALLACEAVVPEMNSGRTTLYGVFDKLTVRSEQPVARPFWIFSKLVGGRGSQTIGFVIEAPSGKEIQFGNAPQSIDFGNGDSSVQTMTTVPPITITEAGIYSIYATSAGRKIGIPCQFFVVLRSEKSKTDKAK